MTTSARIPAPNLMYTLAISIIGIAINLSHPAQAVASSIEDSVASAARLDSTISIGAPMADTSDTVVVTVCGLAVMIIPDTMESPIKLGASMAVHLSNLENTDQLTGENAVASVELADHYHSIRENCGAVRRTNQRDASLEKLQPDVIPVRKDELI